ncbi:GDP-mannose 4,6-dehydratase [Paraclostridium bifermentans]|uniref:GDP-mannose 4,6-dehydratase n=1 Tax=Paraclostridium bifermentans TaxID=1490 RepID=UPI001C80D59B
MYFKYGDGRNIRDWLHVYDHCSAIDLIVHKGKVGEVYNIGGNCELSNIEIVKFLLKNLNRNEDLITFVKDRPGHDLRYAVDSSKIERELGWDRKYNFSYGIIETINWYKENL